LTLTELLEEPAESSSTRKLRAAIPRAPRVIALLSSQQADGGFGVHPYHKWLGAHWRLVSLVELAIPEGNRRSVMATNQVLEWLTSQEHKKHIKPINARIRRCASQEGNALAVCSRLGLADDPRVKYLAESLISWQWPDGGWNCDKRPEAHHSSFHESLIPMWGLVEYHRATGNRESLAAARRTAELLLRHRLFRSEKTGELINPRWLQIHYPSYWHYDILQALLILSRVGELRDSRMKEALDIIESKRLPDGRWKAEGYHWKKTGITERYADPVDWDRRAPNKMITLNALRVLKAAGRWR
jgi:hypothetical protein